MYRLREKRRNREESSDGVNCEVHKELQQPVMSNLVNCDADAKWHVVCAPLAVFVVVVVVGVAFWSTTIISQQNVLQGAMLGVVEDEVHLDLDCDVCAVVHVGDDGASPASNRTLPFPLLQKLLETVRTIKMPSTWRAKIVCVGVDYPGIACRMVRDALGLDASCWQFEQMPRHETPVSCNHMVVGKTSEYLRQPTTFENQTSGRFVFRRMHVVNFDAVADAPVPVVADVRPTIVTGFSANHLSVGLLLLRSIAKAALSTKEANASFAVSVVVWAMEEFQGKDQTDLHCVLKEMKETWGLDVEVRRFKFWQYPEWMRIKQARNGFNEFGTGEYAWKVEMIHTVLIERGLVLWTDAGDRFTTPGSLADTLAYIASNGFASRTSSGRVAEWTHPGTLRYLRATQMTGSNCDGSAVGFALGKYRELARPWYECAMTRQCIAPEGSNRTNHRQDQASLTVLARLSGNDCSGVAPGVGVHMDYDPDNFSGAAPSSCYEDPRRS